MTLTVSQYAKKNRISRQAVLRQIQRGTLKAKKIGHYWVIEIK